MDSARRRRGRGRPDPAFLLGDRVRSVTNGQRGHVTGFRESRRLGFRYVVLWDDEKGYSLVPPSDLDLVHSAARRAPEPLRAAG